MNTHIQRAIEITGSGAALASAISKSPQFVSQLLKGDRAVPAELCPVIERVTREQAARKGLPDAVTCEQLRPDVAWEVLREQVALDPRLFTVEERREHARRERERREQQERREIERRQHERRKGA